MCVKSHSGGVSVSASTQLTTPFQRNGPLKTAEGQICKDVPGSVLIVILFCQLLKVLTLGVTNQCRYRKSLICVGLLGDRIVVHLSYNHIGIVVYAGLNVLVT